jgi:hypothetical protein
MPVLTCTPRKITSFRRSVRVAWLNAWKPTTTAKSVWPVVHVACCQWKSQGILGKGIVDWLKERQ